MPSRQESTFNTDRQQTAQTKFENLKSSQILGIQVKSSVCVTQESSESEQSQVVCLRESGQSGAHLA